jgi:hypothetical protein
LTGTNRARPGLDQALAAVRNGETLVVPKLDRLARSGPDARDFGDALVARGVRLSLGGNIYDPADPMSKMFFNMLLATDGGAPAYRRSSRSPSPGARGPRHPGLDPRPHGPSSVAQSRGTCQNRRESPVGVRLGVSRAGR